MKKEKIKKANKEKHEKKSFKKKVQPFRLSATSGHLLPLQTIGQRLKGIWQSLNWPICVKILKANIAVTIALSLLLIDPIRKHSSTGGILASVAVQFVHPSKSYGFLAEDVFLGTIMCSLSAAWSILAIFLASLVRDPNDAVMAQPKVCAILASFLVIGSFFLSMFRVKVEQANVGGMLSASIMVISITAAVTATEFSATQTLQVLVPTLVGFFLILAMFSLVFPENSTKVFISHLIQSVETFDQMTQTQVKLFLNNTLDAVSQKDSLASVHQQVDTLITTLVQKKKMVRREPSYNFIAPTDVSELTATIKKLRTPIQGLGISRAMEENMRKAEKYVFRSFSGENDHADPKLGEEEHSMSDDSTGRPRSYYGGTDDEENEGSEEEEEEEEEDPSGVSRPHSRVSCQTLTDVMSSNELSLQRPRRPKMRWADSMKVMSCWQVDYDDTLLLVKPIYIELVEACSVAIHASVKRLRRLQCLDVRFKDRPFFYKYYYRWKVGNERYLEESKESLYDQSFDPSVPLFQAIRRFQEHRMIGLSKLYTKTGVPRRILFLLLMFQFNLHTYAETIYTLTSLVYELDQSRSKRRFRLPHMSLTKWIFKPRDMEESVELDAPLAIVETTHTTTLYKAIPRRSSAVPKNDIESQQVLYRLNTPHRGHIRPKESPKRKGKRRLSTDFGVVWHEKIDPMDYHDPDVAYPTTSPQRFFYSLYVFCIKHLYTADVAFSFRAAVMVGLLTIPGFLEDSVGWYNEVRGQWAAVVAVIWMGSSVGSNFFGTMTRTVGTFIGAIESIIIWNASKSSVEGLIILTFFFNLPWWLVYINGKFWKATGLFSLITLSLIIGYTYSFQPNGHPVSVYVITWERTVGVSVGVVAALISSIFPYPRTGRVVLRQRISQTIRDIGGLYSSFLGHIVKNEQMGQLKNNKADRKMFHVAAESIRQQIKGERVLLEQSRFEPALRGIFPEDKYLHILQILENMLSLMLEMMFAFDKMSPRWRNMILKDTWKERKTMIAAYLTAFHLGSDVLTNKTSLPPYVMRPTKARRILTNKIRKLPCLTEQNLGEREYTYFSAYVLSSEQLAVEIELLIAIIRDLVGPDNVCVWLNYKH